MTIPPPHQSADLGRFTDFQIISLTLSGKKYKGYFHFILETTLKLLLSSFEWDVEFIFLSKEYFN